jgi:hypothetical protein
MFTVLHNCKPPYQLQSEELDVASTPYSKTQLLYEQLRPLDRFSIYGMQHDNKDACIEM